MEKLLTLLLIIVFTLSIIPVIPMAKPLTTNYISKLAADTSLIAYMTYGNYAIYVYGMGSSGGYDIQVVVVDNNGNIVLNKTVSADVAYGEVDASANDTGILIAYHYYTGHDIYLVFVKYDGTVVDIGKITNTAATEEDPVVEWGNGYWLVGFVNYTANNFTVRLYDKNFNKVFENSTAIGSHGGVDYRERAFYSGVTNKFYVVLRADNPATGTSDLALLIVDPTVPKTTLKWITETSNADEAYPSYGKLYRRYYAHLLGDEQYLLVVYGYYSGSTNIDGAIIDLTTLAITPITIDTVGGDSNFYPWITASSSEWLVVWSYANNIYARFVYPNGTLSNKLTLAVGGYGFATTVYNGYNYTIIYANETTGDNDLYAMQIDTTGRRGTPIPIAKTPGVDEYYEYPLITGTKHTILYDYGDTAEYLAIVDLSEIPKPTLIPTILTVKLIENDVNGNGYLEAGESVNVTGKLIDSGTGLGIPGKTITVTLVYYILYNSIQRGDEEVNILSVTGTTNSTGGYNIKVDLPSDLLSGAYYIRVAFAGDNVYSGQTNDTTHFLVFHTAPVTPTWETIPSDIAVGPAILVKNGQVIITDPEGDERPDIINTTGEQSDVDIRDLELAFDQNYLYVKADFAGTVTADGVIAPVLAFALDFTPNVYDDGYGAGYTGNFYIAYPWHSETHINNSRAWDVTITITPTHKNNIYHEIITQDGKIPVFIYVSFYDGHDWNQYREILAGYAVFNGGTITAYIPLDTIRYYNNKLLTSGNQSIMLFSAVFAVYTSNDTLVDPLFSNWYDVPGALTRGVTVTNYLNQGFVESYSDNRKYYHGHYSWELDTRFILNMDLDHNRFFGHTKTWFKKTVLEATPITYKSSKVRAFIGSTKYYVVLYDADNPLYTVYGKQVSMLINNTVKASASTNATGFAEITYTWTSSDWKKIANIAFSFGGDNDYVGSGTPNFTAKVLYMINITQLTYNWIDKDKDKAISAGDVITAIAYVKAWDGTAWVTAPDGIGIKFVIYSPELVLGTAYTKNGVAELNYTFTGQELLTGTHSLAASGDGDTSWTSTYPGAEITFTQLFQVLPAPEPPVLPLIVLAILLLFLAIKKRK